ncbi:hypothetical protein B0H11DRAFT_2426023 [Mycena galericulata]|nr:hypothetical protein B0H11DRAFT_2426023 [Mycena galericulata]
MLRIRSHFSFLLVRAGRGRFVTTLGILKRVEDQVGATSAFCQCGRAEGGSARRWAFRCEVGSSVDERESGARNRGRSEKNVRRRRDADTRTQQVSIVDIVSGHPGRKKRTDKETSANPIANSKWRRTSRPVVGLPSLLRVSIPRKVDDQKVPIPVPVNDEPLLG